MPSQNPTGLESQSLRMDLPKIMLNSTQAKPLSLRPTKGMMVYNTNPQIAGSKQYPAQGVGVYTFDGQGWFASQLEATPFSGMSEMGPSLGNAVLLLSGGEFVLPTPEEKIGQFYLIRNTHTQLALVIIGAIDFGKNSSGPIKLGPKDQGAMVYSDGQNWYRLQ